MVEDEQMGWDGMGGLGRATCAVLVIVMLWFGGGRRDVEREGGKSILRRVV